MEFPIPELISKEIEIGYRGIILYSLEDSAREQIGYSIGKNGEPLVGFDHGDWLEGWYVVGRDSCLGDPIFIDLNDPEIPVFTASHGMGFWEPEAIAPSYTSFLSALAVLEGISTGRSGPAMLDANPIPTEDAETYLKAISLIIDQEENYFWSCFIQSELI